MKHINKGNISYNKLFWQEVEYLFRHSNYGNKKLNILGTIEDFIPEENVINAIIAIEGSHVLFNENNEPDNPIIRLRQIKNAATFNVFYLTITHLSRNDYCNHAKGMKISKDKCFDPSLQTKGLDETGLEIIRECYDRANGPRILIDIKHMSLSARRQFYEFRRDNGYQDIPIIASHMGLTGFSYATLSEQLKNKPSHSSNSLVELTYKNQPYAQITFNPLSINLYDEEVLEVINSGGIIGLSLDQRILGRVEKNVRETVRRDELEEWINLENNGLPQIEREKIEAGEKDKVGLRHLCLHIIHIIKLTGSKGWQHICLGSDFDGLIHPINSCKTASELPRLEELLLTELKKVIETSKVEIPCQDIRRHVRDFMFNNLSNFTQDYFCRQYLYG